MSPKPVLAMLLGFLAAAAVPLAAEPFSFVVVGDTTYSPPADYPLYEKLIAAINGVSPVFTIHVGDTKGRGDCWKANRGSADPVKILAVMREVFWAKPESMGKARMPLVRQADADPAFPEFVENARWRHGGATFATLNLAGSHNNQELRVESSWQELIRREEANVAWVKATFAAAKAAGDRAIVLAFHPNPFKEEVRYENGPFDKPGVKHPNVTRLQTYGWPDMKAVRVSVDIGKRWVFGFEPVYADESVSTNPLK